MLRSVFLVSAATLSLMLLLEAAVRLFFNQAEKIVFFTHESAIDVKRDGTYRLKAGMKYRQRNPEFDVIYETNSEGLRDERTYLDKARGTAILRILAIGDSFTFGIGSDYENTWLTILEEMLRLQGREVEIVKAGVPGYDQYQEYRLLKEIIGQYEPGLVLLGFMPNDLFENTWEGEARPANIAGHSNTGLEYQTLALARRLLLKSDVIYKKLYEQSGRGNYFEAEKEQDPQVRRQYQVTAGLLGKIKDLCDSFQAPLAVVSIPQLYQVLKEQGQADAVDSFFTGIARDKNFHWFPMLKAFRRQYRLAGAGTHYRVDGHLTPAGNRILAEEAARQLKGISLQRTFAE